MSEIPSSPALPHHTGWWIAGVASIAVSIASVASGFEFALGIALGALLGWGNLWLLGRAVRVMVQDPEPYRPARGQTWILPGIMLLKWPLLLLALAFILWYMPARPEGVALGALLALVGVCIAASRTNRRQPPPSSPLH